MKKLALGVLLVGLFVACSDDKKKVMVVQPDVTMQCNPLLNTGCPAMQKCTWLLDALMPNYVGHIGCAADGTKQLGEACMYGAPGETGYDDCVHGTVCSNFRGTAPGICKQVCDQQGGMPACDASHVCVIYSNLFDLGDTTPAAAGVCNTACSPLTDNDFDGMGSDLPNRTAHVCGSAAEGCYGSPSYGTPPIAGWSCTRDTSLRFGDAYDHRKQCIEANGCADPGPKVYQNSCNQGYLPLLIENTGSTTTICVSFCKPKLCFLGNCGIGESQRLGAANDSCNANDRLGTLSNSTTSAGHGEHCLFGWRFEIDPSTGKWLKSDSSDTVGYCYDHDKYTYDDDGNTGTAPVSRPPCVNLPDGFGSGNTPGAADLGCVSTSHVTLMQATGKVPPQALENMRKWELPRPLYNRVMNER